VARAGRTGRYLLLVIVSKSLGMQPVMRLI